MVKLFRKTTVLLVAIALIAVFLYVLAFVLTNDMLVNIDFVFFQLQHIPIELVVLASFISGGLSGLLAAFLLLFRAYRKNKQLQKNYLQHLG